MQSPAFPFYVQDFICGTSLMTAEQVGGYLRLLCQQWDKGGIPDDDKLLKRLSGIRKASTLNVVKEKFAKCEDGMLRNERLEREREKRSTFTQAQRQRANIRHQSTENQEGGAQLQITHVDPAIALSSRMRVGDERLAATASELMWQRCADSITELMAGIFSSLRLKDIFEDIDSSCPTGTVFNNDAHLLNKFKVVANTMLKRRQNAQLIWRESPSGSGRPPIVNLKG